MSKDTQPWHKRTPKHIKNSQIKKLLAQCNKRYDSGKRDYALIVFLLETGLRVSEMCSLQWDHINLDDDVIEVWNGKGSKDRVCDLTPTAKNVLEFWKEYAPDSDFVFSTLKGGMMSRVSVAQMLDRRSRKANIKHVSPHMLRHSFAIRVYDVNADLLTVQQALGHSSIRTTERYARASTETMKRSTRNMKPII